MSTLLTSTLHLSPPYLPGHCTKMVTSQGRRKTGGGNASGLCRQVFRAALYSAASESPSPSHTASAPYVFQIRLFSSGATRRARQRTDPRNWISVPCDTTSSGAGSAVLSRKSTVCYWERTQVLCLSILSLGASSAEKNRVELMARLTLCHFHEKKNRQLENPSRIVPENKLSREIRVILDLVLILFTTSANTRAPSCKVFSALLSLRPKPFPPREELLPLQLVSTQLWHCELESNWWPPPN